MKKKVTCARCKKTISGKISIATRKRKLGKKQKVEVEFYDQACFKKINIERSWNVYRKKEAARKRKHNRK